MNRKMSQLLPILVLLLVLFPDGSRRPSSAGVPTPVPSLYVDGRCLQPDVPPVIENGRTLAPLRIIAEAAGCRVEWDPYTQTAVVYRGNDVIRVPADAPRMYKNGALIPLDVPARVQNGRTLLPVRAIVEALGLKIQWLPLSWTAVIESPPQPAAEPFEIWGYFVQYADSDRKSLDSLEHSAASLYGAALFQYSLDARGDLHTTYDPAEAAGRLKAGGRKILALVHNIGPDGRFGSDTAHKLLTSPAARTRAVDSLFRLVSERGYQGVNIDLEDVPPGDRNSYTALIRELADRFRPAGLLVTLSIPAKTGDLPGATWHGAYDYAALGRLADRIMLMTYDEHYAAGSPGPVASLPWVERVLSYAVSVVPPEKLVMGLAAYGYRWPAGGGPGEAVSARLAAQRASAAPDSVSWDDRAQSPVLRSGGGVLHYENSESVTYKMLLARRYRLKGVAVWRLGYEEPGLFQILAGGALGGRDFNPQSE